MYRTALEQLKNWKNKKSRKPLILRGARQTGKTWLMLEFGKKYYKNYIYIDFVDNEIIKSLFLKNFNIERIIKGIELFSGKTIDKDNTLIIFDEIQEVPRALTSLKYFYENAPEYHIICAGSMLGIALHEGTSFPVGKVDFIDIFPMTFFEFLHALGKERFINIIYDYNEEELNNIIYDDIKVILKQYLFIGGMPEVVNSFISGSNYAEIREVQKKIIISYANDFSKHTKNSISVRMHNLFYGIPSQLAKENKKFIYGLIREGARAAEYEYALLWLSDCGLIHQVHRVATPHVPLTAYADPRAFKLYLLDVGLLSCLSGLSPDTLLKGDDLFTEYKGALTEQYVLQQLKTVPGLQVFYWTANRAQAEIDFLVDYENLIIPIEVKATVNLRAKSLRVYRNTFSPPLSIRTSMAGYEKRDGLLNLPLWAIETITTHIEAAFN